jgi:putative acetyltransferase
MPITICSAGPADLPAILHIHRQAFSTPGEAHLVELLHQRGKAVVSLLAERDGQAVGHVLFTPVSFDPPQPQIKAAGLAPLAVLPSYQRLGIGIQLCRTGVQACRLAGYTALVVLGHPSYYPRFGFHPASEFGIDNEYQAREAFMALELQPGALTGIRALAKYAPEFQEIDV